MTIPIKIISQEEYLKENLKPNQEKVWDIISVPWEKYVVKRIPIIKRFLENKKGKILDLGCGSGRNMIPGKNKKYFAVDFSSEQLRNAESYSKEEDVNAEFFKSSADKLPFENEFFDCGLFIATLHCLETKNERENAIKEFYRVLKKGAEGLISVWNSEDKRFGGLKGSIYMSWRENGIPYMRYYYLFDKQELIQLLEKTGFEILEIYKPELHDRFSKKNWILRIKK